MVSAFLEWGFTIIFLIPRMLLYDCNIIRSRGAGKKLRTRLEDSH
jgi:hypothetical protein